MRKRLFPLIFTATYDALRPLSFVSINGPQGLFTPSEAKTTNIKEKFRFRIDSA